MELFILPAARLRQSERKFVADHLTRPNSDFQTALLDGEPAGTIAICLDQGEPIGWARSEVWQGIPTLEAFVSQPYRDRGVATLCAAGLRTHGVFVLHEKIAIFSTAMIAIAERLSLPYRRFALKPGGTWHEVTS
jgi:hypothetical protein